MTPRRNRAIVAALGAALGVGLLTTTAQAADPRTAAKFVSNGNLPNKPGDSFIRLPGTPSQGSQNDLAMAVHDYIAEWGK